MNIHQVTTQLKNGEIRLTIKSLLEKLVKFLTKPRRPKVIKTQKTTTINLERQKTISKISQSVSPNTQIKQVERKQQQKTITSFTEQIPEPVTEFSPAVESVSVNHMSELKPGYLWDTCSIADTEDYPEILKYGCDIRNKLYNGPMYVLTLSNYEYANKKCPANYKEKIVNRGFTGKTRDLYHTLLKLSKSLQVPIYLVDVKNSLEIKQLEKKLLPELRKFGLHPGDSTFLAFSQLTKSTMITSDDRLLFSSVHAQCPKPIDFQKYLEKIMQPSPITVMLRERRNYYKNHNKFFREKYPGWKKR